MQFWGFFLFMRTPFVAELLISRSNTYGEGLLLGDEPRPNPKGMGLQRFQFWDSLLFMCTPFVTEILNLM